MTEASDFFTTARSLPEGKSIYKDCDNSSQAASFRVRLYAERNRTKDYTVEISIAEKRVFLRKAKKTLNYGMLDEDGNEVENGINIDLEKIRKDAEFESARITAISRGFTGERLESILEYEKERIYGREEGIANGQ